ncbi:hypothetical protein CSKR_108913 [Clonorchis sinensis]|uniref:Uncharacterized protein n=1 Tax=Clonorchis sinensis TaxID=79923 RepID=A0A3R7D444_CLOSI|nr:hypothetical protein CSKR_108913 [Clonorchis sinensis]
MISLHSDEAKCPSPSIEETKSHGYLLTGSSSDEEMYGVVFARDSPGTQLNLSLGDRGVRFCGPTFSNPSFLGGRQHRCFHKYGDAGRLGETPYCLHTPIAEDSTTLPPDRLVIRLLAVRGLAVLRRAAPPSIARRIIAARKPDHHDKVTAFGRVQTLNNLRTEAPYSNASGQHHLPPDSL